MILAFAHPGIVVPDLEAAVTFYYKMFGFEVINQEGWSDCPEADLAVGAINSACKGHMMKGHNCFLELWQYSSPTQSVEQPGKLGAQELGIRHLAFYVDDCRHEYERLLDLGGQVLGEPVASENGVYVAYCRDPFGNIIELCEIPVPEENPTRLPGVDKLGNFSG